VKRRRRREGKMCFLYDEMDGGKREREREREIEKKEGEGRIERRGGKLLWKGRKERRKREER
jgi:hypothetical protein